MANITTSGWTASSSFAAATTTTITTSRVVNGSSLTELYSKLARGDVSVFQGPWSVDPLLGAPTAYGFENAPAV
jgi:hypothetical protein